MKFHVDTDRAPRPGELVLEQGYWSVFTEPSASPDEVLMVGYLELAMRADGDNCLWLDSVSGLVGTPRVGRIPWSAGVGRRVGMVAAFDAPTRLSSPSEVLPTRRIRDDVNAYECIDGALLLVPESALRELERLAQVRCAPGTTVLLEGAALIGIVLEPMRTI